MVQAPQASQGERREPQRGGGVCTPLVPFASSSGLLPTYPEGKAQPSRRASGTAAVHAESYPTLLIARSMKEGIVSA